MTVRTMKCYVCKESFETETTDEEAIERGMGHPMGIDSTTGSRDNWAAVCEPCVNFLNVVHDSIPPEKRPKR